MPYKARLRWMDRMDSWLFAKVAQVEEGAVGSCKGR